MTLPQFVWASTAAAVIERFGGFSAYTILGEDNLNSAANAFTASSTPHNMFDRLDLWLMPAQVCGILWLAICDLLFTWFRTIMGTLLQTPMLCILQIPTIN